MTREQEIKDAARRETYLYNEYYNFERGAKWADEHPNWIDAKKQYPKLGEDVIVLQSSLHKMTVAHTFKARNTETDEIEVLWSESLMPSLVDYWMPQPKYPVIREEDI